MRRALVQFHSTTAAFASLRYTESFCGGISGEPGPEENVAVKLFTAPAGIIRHKRSQRRRSVFFITGPVKDCSFPLDICSCWLGIGDISRMGKEDNWMVTIISQFLSL